ncbi:MAG TPA: hypothetical protein DCK99_18500 [Blastocatellia bacterium]|nr:hypothetical protein [Blastocatellia bacterium]
MRLLATRLYPRPSRRPDNHQGCGALPVVVSEQSPQQVQVAWLKQALIDPANYGGFPTPAQKLQEDLETIIRNIKRNYPNIKLTYLSSRTRAYTTTFHNPEPFAYESGFAVKWTIALSVRRSPDWALQMC